jgi:hypothetical protein
MQELNFRRWKSNRTGYSVMLGGERVGHVERSKDGGHYTRMLRPIGRRNYRKVEQFACRLCPGMAGIAVGWISDCER